MSSIGAQLKQVRESRGLSIKQAVQATRIRDYYIEAMEADDFSAIPSAAQARGFLRSYADFLKLNADELINQQRAEGTAIPEFITPNQVDVPSTAAQPPSSTDPAELPHPALAQPLPEPEAADEMEPAPTGSDVPLAEAESAEPDLSIASNLIFAEIGNSLRQRRELISLTLDEIERHTHVRKYYLNIIEAGRFDDLPSPVQARGMLSNYASFLDMNTDTVLLRFADALQARRLERQASLPPTQSSRSRFMLPIWLRRLISPDLLFGGGMIALLFFLTIWGAVRVFSRENTAAQAPSISDVLLDVPTLAPTLTEALLPTNVNVETVPDGQETATPTETTLADGTTNAGLQLTISVLERTFVRVTVDGVVQKEGRLLPGFAQTFEGAKTIEVLTGSGAAIQILFNQHNLGPMGNLGEVVDLIYTADGAQTPTITPSPTATETPRFQKSPTPTRTPTLTPTPSLTRTPSLTPTVKP